MFADLAESSRLLVANELDAIRRWLDFSQRASSRWLPETGGRLVRTDGDGLLIEFGHASAAAAGAFALHLGIDAVNDGYPGEEHMALRIGMHVGEVLFDDHEAYGAQVNLAKRVASLAQPAQTLASAAARDELIDGLHADITDLGLRHVKHDEGVRVFALSPCGVPASAAASRRSALPPAADLRPAIAVVPFVSMDAEPELDALGHAVADELIPAFARHPGLRVLSRATTAALRHDPVNFPRLQELLGASYLLTGRYYRHGHRIKARIELAELHQGQVLWTGDSIFDAGALFEGQDELVPHVVANVSQHVAAHEMARVRSLPMESLDGYSLYIGAAGLMNSLVVQEFGRAREVMEHLAERYPRNAVPQAALSRWHVFNAVQGWAGDGEAAFARATEHAHRAIEIDPRQPQALAARALVRMAPGDADGAHDDCRSALALDPSDAMTWAYLSAAQSYRAETTQAQQSAAEALRLSPLDPNRYLLEAYAAMADVAAGDFDAAVLRTQASLRRHALHTPSHVMLVGALWQAGRHEEARSASKRALQLCPHIRADRRGRLARPGIAGWRERLAEAAVCAGLPR